MNTQLTSPTSQKQIKGNKFCSAPGTTFLHTIAFILVINVLAACNGNSAPPAQNQDKIKSDSLAAANDSLQAKRNAAQAQIDQLMTRTAQLDSMIRRKDAQIAVLKKTNGHLALSNKQLAAELKADKNLIASLRDELNDSTKSFADRLGLLQNDKNDLMRQRDSLLSKYNQVVALGSVLHASNIRLTAVHVKHSGKEKDTHRARRADMLKVDFDIDMNRIAESGTKKLYLVIKDPSGNLLSNPAAGSGNTTTNNGSQLNYSVLKEIPLVANQPVNDISVEWKQEGDYEKGAYTITIYNGGYKIGGSQVELK